jgi:hypothetical protein
MRATAAAITSMGTPISGVKEVEKNAQANDHATHRSQPNEDADGHFWHDLHYIRMPSDRVKGE